MSVAYDPAARHRVEIWDEEFRRGGTRALFARIYRPRGAGPFPVLLDLHGGAWTEKDRLANAPMDEALAASGVLVVAIDLTLAREAPYPASVQDANYGVRWLKARAREWGGDPDTVGVLGSSSGGHVAELCAMRPRDPRYGAHPLPQAPGLDAAVAYVVARSPISDPLARYEHALQTQRADLVEKTRAYFAPWETIYEANPQRILERREPVATPPLLILQGGRDENVPVAVQEKFAAAYRAAGGECQLEIFPECGHMWVAQPGPETERAHELVKAFIAARLRGLRRAA